MTVGIAGPFCDNNFGDYTMLLNDVYDIVKSGKDVKKIVIFCYNTSLVEKLCDDYFAGFCTEIFEIKTLVEKAGQNAYIGVDRMSESFTPHEVLHSIENIEELRSKVKELDLMISCGGGHFDYYWLGLKRRYRLFSIIAPCIVARQQNKKIAMLGHSFGPWGSNGEFFFGLFNYIKFDAIDCRDNLYSKKYLNLIGVNENVREVCDDLAVINPAIENWCTDSSLPLKGYYILDIYSSIQDIEHNIGSIISFAKKMKAERQLRPLFVAHGPDYNGSRQAELLKRFLPELEIYKSKKEYLPPEEFIKLLKGAEFVLCEHYHSFVLSTTHKVPAVMVIRKIDGSHFYYYNKTVGFLKISGVLEKSHTGEDLFCVMSLPDLFDSSEKFESRIRHIKKILNDFDFTKENKKMDYLNEILNLARGGVY